MATKSEARLDLIYSALSDPSRRLILQRLSQGEATVGDVSAPLRVSAPSVSKHLKVLEHAGLIGRRVEGRKHYLFLKADASPQP